MTISKSKSSVRPVTTAYARALTYVGDILDVDFLIFLEKSSNDSDLIILSEDHLRWNYAAFCAEVIYSAKETQQKGTPIYEQCDTIDHTGFGASIDVDTRKDFVLKMMLLRTTYLTASPIDKIGTDGS